MNMIEVINSYE